MYTEGREILDNYFITKAVEAVKNTMVGATPAKDEPNYMDRYDMTPVIPTPTWRDVASIPYVLAVIGASYVRYLFNERFSRIK